ncbi:MAG: PAS domain S-box protein, partial [Deltaproteobacteria bacterium]|nr:PAS domain S-box protein [Deltaproteobacteria bacterium]
MSQPPPLSPISPGQSDLVGRVFEASPVAIVVSSVDGQVARVNAAMTTLLGYSYDELAHLTAADISHPDDLILGINAMRDALAGRCSEGRFAKRYLTKQGKIVWADVHFALLRDANGAPTHFVTHIVDLSAQRAYERKWYTLFENAADGVFVAGADGYYLDANPAGLRMLGTTVEELRRLRMVDIIDPADLAAHPLRERDLERDGGVTTLRKIRRKDGSMLHAEIAARRLPDGTAIGIVRDVGRREREAAVMGLRLLVEELIRERTVDSVVAAALGPAIQMVDSDRGALQVLDRGRKLIGQAWLPDHAAALPPPLLSLGGRATQVPLEAQVDEIEGVRRLVVPVAVDGMVSAVIQAAGKPTPYLDEDRAHLAAIASAVVDVITRHRAEQFLRATVDRLALASDAARIGVWEIDLATQQVTWDDHMYALFGVDPPQPGHEHEVWRAALSEVDRLGHDATVREALARGADLHTDIQVRTATGESRVLEAHARIQVGPDGRPLRLVGLNIDVTARRRDEAELRKHRDHLDELVRARTQELDRSNRELEQFAMVASHDLKAPLRTI